MATPPRLDFIEVLYASLHADFGVVVETEDAERLRQKLYAIRKENPDFLPLAFVLSPFDSTLWIIHPPKKET